MDTPGESSTGEATPRDDFLHVLASVTALPALWTDGEPAQIIGTLLDALLEALQLDVVFVRLNDPEDGPAIDMVRVAESLQAQLTDGAREISQMIDSSLGDAPSSWPPRARVSIGSVDLSLAGAPLGLRGEIGILAAGSPRSDFPTPTEKLVLDVAANQTALGLRQARLLRESER